jgi:hypothetical protein
VSAQPGDFVLIHGNGFISRAIRFGQRLRVRKPFNYWNHAAVVMGGLSDGGLLVIEAGAHGVQWGKVIPGPDAQVVSAPGGLAACGFAKAAVGRRYGFLTIASIILDLLTPRFIDVKRPGTFICSGLVARALEHGGYILPMGWDPDQVMPAELGQHFNAVP